MGVMEAPTKHSSRKLSVYGNCRSGKRDLFCYTRHPSSWAQLRAAVSQGAEQLQVGERQFYSRPQILQQFLKKQESFTSFSSFKLESNTWKAKLPWLYGQIWDKLALAQCPCFSMCHYPVLFIFSSSSCIPVCILIPKMLSQNKIQ